MDVRSAEARMLEQVMRKTEGLLARVKPEQAGLPTPCAEWNVGQLEDHLVGWARHFAARESGVGTGAGTDEDPAAYRVQDDAAREFDATIDPLVTALDGKIAAPAPADPGAPNGFPPTALATMLTGEYVVHGWDLATATGQAVPFTDAEAEASLGMRAMLTPENRDGMFGPEVPAAPDATPLQQMIAFAGRYSPTS